MNFTDFAVLTALTSGVVEVIKRIKILDDRWLPLVSLVVGFCLSGVSAFFSFTSLTILEGIAVGLSAAGLFDQTKIAKK